MTQTPPPATSLPHHKLFAYELCLSLVKLVAKTRAADAQLRAQARKSAASDSMSSVSTKLTTPATTGANDALRDTRRGTGGSGRCCARPSEPWSRAPRASPRSRI